MSFHGSCTDDVMLDNTIYKARNHTVVVEVMIPFNNLNLVIETLDPFTRSRLYKPLY